MAKTSTSAKQKRDIFVNSYLLHGNATKAAVDAGFSEKTAAQAGSRMLKRKDVADAIAERSKGAMGKLAQSADAALQHLAVTADNIIAALAEMGLAHKVLAKFLKVDTQGLLYYNFTGATLEELATIQPMIHELNVEQFLVGQGEAAQTVLKSRIKFADRKGVLELLGRWKRLKMWTDKVEVEETDPTKRDRRITELLMKAGGRPLSVQ